MGGNGLGLVLARSGVLKKRVLTAVGYSSGCACRPRVDRLGSLRLAQLSSDGLVCGTCRILLVNVRLLGCRGHARGRSHTIMLFS